MTTDLLSYIAVAAVAIGLPLFLLARFVSRRLDDTSVAFLRRLDNMAQQSSALLERLPPSVFLKPIGDEAALALAWTSAMAALMQAGSTLLFLSLQWVRDRWNRVPPTVRFIGGVLFATAWALGTGSALNFYKPLKGALEIIGYYLHEGDWLSLLLPLPLIVAVFTWAALLLMVLALFAVLLVALLAAVGVGMPSLKTALYLRISVEAIPVGAHRLVLVDVSSPPSVASSRLTPGGLSHSAVYNSPDAIRAVIEALEGFETARASASQSDPQLAGV